MRQFSLKRVKNGTHWPTRLRWLMPAVWGPWEQLARSAAWETKRVVIRQSERASECRSPRGTRQPRESGPRAKNNKRLLLLVTFGLTASSNDQLSWSSSQWHVPSEPIKSAINTSSALSPFFNPQELYFFLLAPSEVRDAKWLLLHRFLRARPTIYFCAAVFFLIDLAHVHSRHVDLGQMEEIGRDKQI